MVVELRVTCTECWIGDVSRVYILHYVENFALSLRAICILRVKFTWNF